MENSCAVQLGNILMHAQKEGNGSEVWFFLFSYHNQICAEAIVVTTKIAYTGLLSVFIHCQTAKGEKTRKKYILSQIRSTFSWNNTHPRGIIPISNSFSLTSFTDVARKNAMKKKFKRKEIFQSQW